MVAAPVAGDHIGRNRPGTAGKAEEGNLGRQGVRHPAHGLDDRIETFRTRHETLDTDAGQWRRKPGSLARPEAQLLPKRRSEEHTSELQSLMRISYAVFCLHKKKTSRHKTLNQNHIT